MRRRFIWIPDERGIVLYDKSYDNTEVFSRTTAALVDILHKMDRWWHFSSLYDLWLQRHHERIFKK